MDINEHRVYAYSANSGLSRCPIGQICFGGNSRVEASCNRLLVDLSGLSFVSISQVVALTQLMLNAKLSKIEVALMQPKDEAQRYIARMNCFELLGIQYYEDFTRHAARDAFIPMRRIVEHFDVSSIATKMAEMVSAWVEVTNRDVTSLVAYAFGEFMDNVLEHSNSKAHGIAAAQYYPNLGFIELCVADSGQGIASSMRENPRYGAMSSTELVQNAFLDGYGQYIGRTDFGSNKVSRGRGLYVASQVAKALGGYIWVHSRSECLELSGSGVKMLHGYYYPGTVVSARLPINRGTIIVGSQINPDWKSEPILWSAQEGFYYAADAIDATENPLW